LRLGGAFGTGWQLTRAGEPPPALNASAVGHNLVATKRRSAGSAVGPTPIRNNNTTLPGLPKGTSRTSGSCRSCRTAARSANGRISTSPTMNRRHSSTLSRTAITSITCGPSPFILFNLSLDELECSTA
jgi:hypothetical protein